MKEAEFNFDFRDIFLLNGLGSIDLNEKKQIKCPLCDDKKKHMQVVNQPPKLVYRCARCGEGGGILKFHQVLNDLDSTKDALSDIKKRLNQTDEEVKVRKVERQRAKRLYKEAPILPLNERDRRYNVMLEHMKLSDYHKDKLLERGLTERFITQRKYKSLAVVEQDRKELAGWLGEDAQYLPGFTLTNRGYYQCWFGEGILLPVRSLNGKIQGFQIRYNQKGKKNGKYGCFSKPDVRMGGRMESYTHIACDFIYNDNHKVVPKIKPNTDSIKLTEGCLKADVYFCITGEPMLGILGVNNIGHLKQTLLELQRIYPNIKKVEDCFDMDYIDNPAVQKASENLIKMLTDIGFEYERRMWDEKYKGVDDFAYEYLINRKNNVSA